MMINIVAGGPEELLPDLSHYSEEDVIWLGVDRGVMHLLERDLQPHIAFGDFDSVTKSEIKLIEAKVMEMQRYKPEKDETDMELALNWALQQNPRVIRIFGGTGGRLDHLFANVQLLITPLQQNQTTEISLIDCKNVIYLRKPGIYRIEKMTSLKYISFLPLTVDIPDLTLKGFKFPLENRHISLGSTLCISNELISDYGTFSFSKGILIVIRSHD